MSRLEDARSRRPAAPAGPTVRSRSADRGHETFRSPIPRLRGRSRRQLAALVASRLGLLHALRQVRLNRGLLVMAYHRVGDPADCPVDEDLVCVSRRRLVAHARLLARWSRMVSLAELEERYAGRGFGEPLSLLTFDDAYRDNYTTAFPALAELGLSAVFFVPTGLIERRHVPWWDRISYAVKHSRRDEARLSYPEGFTLHGMHRSPRQAVVEVLRRYKGDANLDKERLLTALEEATGACALDAPEVGELFASWAELREMAAGGMEIASHAHSHRLLAHLPYAEQYEELARSREILREQVGVDTRALAYPVGSEEHFDAETRRALQALDYRLGFSHYGGWNPTPADPFDIRRIRVDQQVDTPLVNAVQALPQAFAA